ncbi:MULTISPECIES: FAD-binding protein [Rhodomicrobium]|uniref:FAD-binding protein n=1 Tax=Rhodomicrobium TaxID=1068 RepID=UPI000B4AAD9F|nr:MULTISPECIES: FAD-binding protein [Rhodomicrobium]
MYVNETYLPSGEQELAALIAQAAGEKLPLEICGNRTKRNIGRPLQTATRVSTGQMRGITLYEPTELVLSAKAGTPLAEIEALLEKNNQELAFEPCHLDQLSGGEQQGGATIGGVFAVNASGPRRVLRGSARDHLIGVRAVNGMGEIVKSGGRVMKNVTGYDLARGIAGSWGTLAVLTEVTMKVLPKAEDTRSLLFLNLPDEGAVNAMCRAMGSPFEVSGTVHLPASFVERLSMPDIAKLGQPVTALRIENFASSLDYRTGRLHEALQPFGAIYELDDARSRAFWRDIRNLTFLTGSDWPLWRISTAPDKGAKLVSALKAQLECTAAYEWSGGLIWVEVPPATDSGAAVLRRIIAEFGADAMLVRANATSRAAIDVFQPLPEVNMGLIRRLKEAFDPQRILSPGRMYAGI